MRPLSLCLFFFFSFTTFWMGLRWRLVLVSRRSSFDFMCVCVCFPPTLSTCSIETLWSFYRSVIRHRATSMTVSGQFCWCCCSDILLIQSVSWRRAWHVFCYRFDRFVFLLFYLSTWFVYVMRTSLDLFSFKLPIFIFTWSSLIFFVYPSYYSLFFIYWSIVGWFFSIFSHAGQHQRH